LAEKTAKIAIKNQVNVR